MCELYKDLSTHQSILSKSIHPSIHFVIVIRRLFYFQSYIRYVVYLYRRKPNIAPSVSIILISIYIYIAYYIPFFGGRKEGPTDGRNHFLLKFPVAASEFIFFTPFFGKLLTHSHFSLSVY